MTEAETREGSGEHAGAARRILFEGVSLGFLADFALRTAPGGLGWTLWIAGLTLAAVNLSRYRGLKIGREEVAWLAVAVACASAFAWRDAEELRAMNVIGTLIALAMWAMSAAGRPVASILIARLRDVISGGIYTIRDLLVGTTMLVARDAELSSLQVVRGGASWSALRAVILTAPVVFVFTVLLSRADPIFASLFQLPAIDAERLVSHIALAGVFTWLSSGFLRGAVLGVSRRPRLPDQLPLRLGLAEVTTSLGAVTLLFAIFVALQIRWLFSGADVVLATTGLTAAEYARRGFFELVAVSLLVLPLILGTRALIADEAVERRHRRLSLALLAFHAAIITSALLRMGLYVGYFGLSTDRLYATAIMIWLAMVSAAMAFTVLRGRSGPFAALTAVAGFATLGALNVVNPELLIARANLARPSEVRTVDYLYLSRLSGDAMPALVSALQQASPSADACKAATTIRRRWIRAEDPSWNVGARRGRTAVVRTLSPSDVVRLCAGGTAGDEPNTGNPAGGR